MNKDKMWFRRFITLNILLSIMNLFIPHFLNFELYYGLHRFVDPGYVSSIFKDGIDLYLISLLTLLSIISYLTVYFFKPIGKILYSINIIFTLLVIMLSGDSIEYGLLYPFKWLGNGLEILILYLMYFGNIKKEFFLSKT